MGFLNSLLRPWRFVVSHISRPKTPGDMGHLASGNRGNCPDFPAKKARIQAECPIICSFSQTCALILLGLRNGPRRVLSRIGLFAGWQITENKIDSPMFLSKKRTKRERTPGGEGGAHFGFSKPCLSSVPSVRWWEDIFCKVETRMSRTWKRCGSNALGRDWIPAADEDPVHD
jgi:hypothetical protein